MFYIATSCPVGFNWNYLWAFGIAFFIGGLPFSFIIPKLFKGIDIRTVGSKNVGATNVYRTCGLGYGVAAALLDITKGAIVYLVAQRFFCGNVPLVLGAATVIGHCYSPWLGLDGGKGVATTGGIILFYSPPIFLILLSAFILTVAISKYVSLGTLVAALSLPILTTVFSKNYDDIKVLVILVVLVIFRHIPNIKRLLAGTESKVTDRLKKGKSDAKK